MTACQIIGLYSPDIATYQQIKVWPSTLALMFSINNTHCYHYYERHSNIIVEINFKVALWWSRACQGFLIGGAKTEGPKIEAEGWKEEGTATLSPPARESGGALSAKAESGGGFLSSPARFRAEPRPPKGFSLLSALKLASPDTIILLVVDYYDALMVVQLTLSRHCRQECLLWNDNDMSLV